MLKAKNKFMAVITCLLLTLLLAFGGMVMTTNVAHAEGETVTEGETTSGLTVKMTDDYGDGWNSATIGVYQDGEPFDVIEFTEGTEKTWTSASYDETATYVFVWNKGSYDDECSFTIEVNGTEKFSATKEDCEKYTDGQWIFSTCEHSFAEGGFVCENCNITCGKEFLHKITAERVCEVCGYECGVIAEHDWSNLDGVCGICALECVHTFEGLTCTICDMTYAATVIAAGETEGTLYATIFEAFENAADGATVKLLSDISVDNYVYIEDKTLIIDLNGCAWESSTWGMYAAGTSNVTITDTSEEESGVLYSTNAGTPTLMLRDTARLELAGGTIRHDTSNPISITRSGNPVEAHFVMTGGKLQGDSITAQGNSVTIKGGVLDIPYILLKKGDLDLSEYPNPVGICVRLSLDLSEVGTVYLPENYALLDKAGESAYVEYGEYTVTHTACEYDNACDGNCNVCLQDTRTPAEHDWSNLDGVCGVCDKACTHTFEERTCSICGFTYTVGVFADGASEGILYTTIFEAFQNAADGATVKLLSDISVDNYVYIEDKTLIIDLNGCAWVSSTWGMYAAGASNVTITDTSEEESGVLYSTNAGTPTLILRDTARLELAGGTITHTEAQSMVNIANGGQSVDAHFVMTGGKLQGRELLAQGNSVTIKGGVLDISHILLRKGDLDLSEYPNPAGICVHLPSNLSEVGTVYLPENYALLDKAGESTYVEYGEYTVTHTACEYDNACDGNCNVCLQDTRTPAEHTGGTATCTQQAVCAVCGVSYGEVAKHEYDNACDGNCNVCLQDTRTPAEHEYDNACDGNCNVCLQDTRTPAEHTGGTATCTQQAVCAVCGVSYGGVAEHEYDNACDGNCNVCLQDARTPAAHVDEDKNGTCDVCTAEVPVEPDSSIESSDPETSDEESSTPETSNSTTPETSDSTTPVTSDSEEESGCSSMIDGISMAALALVGLAVFVKKRKEN